MKTVKISELKAHLSAHLRMASAGEEVLVYDRNQPIARIVPVGVTGESSRRERLIAKGILTPPRRPKGEPRYIPVPAGNPMIPQAVIDAFWEEERADR